jgi:hypothetical protein
MTSFHFRFILRKERMQSNGNQIPAVHHALWEVSSSIIAFMFNGESNRKGGCGGLA